MTVSSTTTKNSYSGNGSTHSFAYGFKIFADADLTVIIRSSTGAETVRTLNTHYIVTNAGNDSGGNVLFKFNTGTSSDAHFSSSDFRPASGETVVIRRNLTLTQGTDYVENDPFPAESHENALDRVTFITQQLQEELDRSIKLSRTNTITSPEFTTSSTDRANKVLAFDSSGEISVTQEIGTFKGNWAASTSYLVRDIVKDTSTNNIFIVTSAHTSSGSQPLTTNANSAKYSLIVDAASSTTSQTAAASSATAAASSATAAASSASTASTQASNASTSASTASTQATNAASSATAASNAQAAAEAALDTFDDRFLGAKSSDPSVDNDGNALIDGALYFDTTNDIMKVYDLTNTQWRQLTLTSTNQNNVNTVAGAISNVNTVAGSISNINTANSNITNIDTVAGISSNVTTVAGISSNVTTVAGISSNVTSVAGNSSNINSAVSNATNINTVAGAVTNINTVASNVSGVNSFAERYRVQSGVPSSDNDVGDLVFDTAANTLKVFGASGFQNAGSSVNGTSARFHYDIGSAVTSVTGSDANGNTLAYDAGFIDVYVNGVRMSTADVTVTSGDTVTFAEALSASDEVDIVCYGTFVLANIVSTGALNSGSITSGFGNIDTGSSTITTTGAITGGSLVVDNITLDGSEITLAGSGDMTVNVGGDIILDADTRDIKLQDGGTDWGRFTRDTTTAPSSFVIDTVSSDVDMKFKGNDGGSVITALTLDMSDGGTASFRNHVTFADGGIAKFGGASDLQIYHDGSNSYIDETGTGDLYIRANPSVYIQKYTGENMIVCSVDGSVNIYHNNVERFQTSANGIEVLNTTAGEEALVRIKASTNGNSAIAFGDTGNTTVGKIDYNHADNSFAFDTNSSERMRIDSSGNVLIGTTGSMDLGFGAQRLSVRTIDGNAPLIVGNGHNTSGAGFICYASSQSYASNLCDLRVGRSANTAYNFFEMRSNSAVSNDSEFRFRGDGNAFADGSFSGGGADYAEYFEWKDGNTDNEDRRGYTVVLDGHQIRKSTSDDNASTIIGVVSGNPSMVGDSDINQWKHKYQKDNYGTYISDKNGDRVLNSSYDDTKEYVSREDRQEWNTIGLMGKLRIRVGQTVGSNWIKMREISDTVHEYLVR